MSLPPIALFRCSGCGAADGEHAPGCPEHAAFLQIEAEVRAELVAARKQCAAEGHVGVWERCDYWSSDVEYVCDRCGEYLDEDDNAEGEDQGVGACHPAGGAR